MKQQETFAETRFDPNSHVSLQSAFLLGRAVAILEGLVESPTDAIDMQLAGDLLADYREWMEQES